MGGRVHPRFEKWWDSLSENEQVEIAAKVELLQEFGPTLSRPHADVITSSRHANMKELRGRVQGRHLRVLYAFDKTGDPTWYERFVPVADDLFDERLKQFKKGRQR